MCRWLLDGVRVEAGIPHFVRNDIGGAGGCRAVTGVAKGGSVYEQRFVHANAGMWAVRADTLVCTTAECGVYFAGRLRKVGPC